MEMNDDEKLEAMKNIRVGDVIVDLGDFLEVTEILPCISSSKTIFEISTCKVCPGMIRSHGGNFCFSYSGKFTFQYIIKNTVNEAFESLLEELE